MTDRTYYVRGNTVRKEQRVQRRQLRPVELPRRKRAVRHMSLGYLVFMSAALLLSAGILAWYISLQAQIAGSVKNISSLESQLNDLKESNEEAYNLAKSSVDLEEIKRIAIEELGMQYADEGQIVSYSDAGGDDYVNQTAEIPSEKAR